MNTEQDDLVIRQIKCWLENVVIDLNFCPFAQREFTRQRIHYDVSQSHQLESALQDLADALLYLQQHPEIETSLLILPQGFVRFDDFLELIDLGEQLVDELGYRSVFQLAHFHPDYCFADSDDRDAANFTNRAPWPCLHLLREASLQKAIDTHPDTATIPETNIQLARQLGFDKMLTLLDNCRK